MSLNSANFQQDTLGVFAILEPGLVASLVDVLKPIGIGEVAAASLLKRVSQLRTHRFPMNSTVTFSFVLIIVAHKLHDQFRDVCFKSVSFDLLTSKNVIPLFFFNWNGYFRMIVPRVQLIFWLLRTSFFDGP